MEGKITNDINSKISQDNKDENKIEQIKNNKNRIFFNSVTGEQMDIDDGNEADMYEVVPDMEQYAQDNISQYTDIYEKDKQFFKLWNSFIKSKENTFYKFEDILIEFLNKYRDFISLTITLDGPKEVHDTCRVDHNGKGSFDQVIAAWKDWNKINPNINTKITISPENLS